MAFRKIRGSSGGAGGGGGSIDEAAVDARVRAIVDDFAEVGAGANIAAEHRLSLVPPIDERTHDLAVTSDITWSDAPDTAMITFATSATEPVNASDVNALMFANTAVTFDSSTADRDWLVWKVPTAGVDHRNYRLRLNYPSSGGTHYVLVGGDFFEGTGDFRYYKSQHHVVAGLTATLEVTAATESTHFRGKTDAANVQLSNTNLTARLAAATNVQAALDALDAGSVVDITGGALPAPTAAQRGKVFADATHQTVSFLTETPIAGTDPTGDFAAYTDSDYLGAHGSDPNSQVQNQDSDLGKFYWNWNRHVFRRWRNDPGPGLFVNWYWQDIHDPAHHLADHEDFDYSDAAVRAYWIGYAATDDALRLRVPDDIATGSRAYGIRLNSDANGTNGVIGLRKIDGSGYTAGTNAYTVYGYASLVVPGTSGVTLAAMNVALAALKSEILGNVDAANDTLEELVASIPDASNADPEALAESAAEGTSDDFSRSDHVHPEMSHTRLRAIIDAGEGSDDWRTGGGTSTTQAIAAFGERVQIGRVNYPTGQTFVEVDFNKEVPPNSILVVRSSIESSRIREVGIILGRDFHDDAIWPAFATAPTDTLATGVHAYNLNSLGGGNQYLARGATRSSIWFWGVIGIATNYIEFDLYEFIERDDGEFIRSEAVADAVTILAPTDPTYSGSGTNHVAGPITLTQDITDSQLWVIRVGSGVTNGVLTADRSEALTLSNSIANASRQSSAPSSNSVGRPWSGRIQRAGDASFAHDNLYVWRHTDDDKIWVKTARGDEPALSITAYPLKSGTSEYARVEGAGIVLGGTTAGEASGAVTDSGAVLLGYAANLTSLAIAHASNAVSLTLAYTTRAPVAADRPDGIDFLGTRWLFANSVNTVATADTGVTTVTSVWSVPASIASDAAGVEALRDANTTHTLYWLVGDADMARGARLPAAASDRTVNAVPTFDVTTRQWKLTDVVESAESQMQEHDIGTYTRARYTIAEGSVLTVRPTDGNSYDGSVGSVAPMNRYSSIAVLKTAIERIIVQVRVQNRFDVFLDIPREVIDATGYTTAEAWLDEWHAVNSGIIPAVFVEWLHSTGSQNRGMPLARPNYFHVNAARQADISSFLLFFRHHAANSEDISGIGILAMSNSSLHLVEATLVYNSAIVYTPGA